MWWIARPAIRVVQYPSVRLFDMDQLQGFFQTVAKFTDDRAKVR
jgi:hypothetical protein